MQEERTPVDKEEYKLRFIKVEKKIKFKACSNKINKT
jgi:hypothetical protein